PILHPAQRHLLRSPSAGQLIFLIARPVEMGHEGTKYGDDGRPTCDCLLFDLDDTLYPVGSGIGLDVMKNIQEYMVEKLGIDKSVSHELCILLYKQYGTTMAGLRAVGYQFDYDDFHGFVHGRLAYEKLKPDPLLRNILLSLPIRKLVRMAKARNVSSEPKCLDATITMLFLLCC
uniref:Uncharacterized protein n=1 Tax=Aegilops tauschii subsp. strangulata TaxID=200361 RepID=A0A453GWX5_AEGTS